MLVKKWQKFTVLNVGILLGIVASNFMLPSNTPAWLWAAISIVVIITMNYLLVRKLRSAAGTPREQVKGSTVIIAVGFLIVLIDMLVRLAHRTH